MDGYLSNIGTAKSAGL